jgi:hypothetical protein
MTSETTNDQPIWEKEVANENYNLDRLVSLLRHGLETAQSSIEYAKSGKDNEWALVKWLMVFQVNGDYRYKLLAILRIRG